MSTDWTKYHCPYCLSPLSTVGDCWTRCEYEAHNHLPGFAPLTRRQFLERKLVENEQQIVRFEHAAVELRRDNTDYRAELETLK